MSTAIKENVDFIRARIAAGDVTTAISMLPHPRQWAPACNEVGGIPVLDDGGVVIHHPVIIDQVQSELVAEIERKMELGKLTTTARIPLDWVKPEPFKVHMGPKIEMDFSKLEDYTAAALVKVHDGELTILKLEQLSKGSDYLTLEKQFAVALTQMAQNILNNKEK